MSCEFSLEHYRELLDAATGGGYRFASFDREPRPGDLFLRHDVDLSLDAALQMAELEAHAEAPATYFLMTQSVFYNLASPEGVRAINRLRELGHRIGLHAVWPGAESDDRFDPVLAWHNPEPDYMSQPLDEFVNVMQPPFFDPDHYRSDSNQSWRHGCPHPELARRRLRVAPAPRPPGDLGVSGGLDERDDERDARRRAPKAASASRPQLASRRRHRHLPDALGLSARSTARSDDASES